MIYKIIQELASTRSRNDKEAILRREVGNDDLKNFFRLALDPFTKFYQKKTFLRSNYGHSSLTEAMRIVERDIAGRVLTGNSAVYLIDEILAGLPDDDGKVIMLILSKKSGCDLGASTINKIWPKLIRTTPMLLATAYTEKLAEKLNWIKGVFSQLKSDGLRINIVIDEEGGVNAYSRAGNELNFFGVFDYLGEYMKSVVIDGELLTVNETGKFNSRQVSNGICSKAIKCTMSEAEAATLHITAWDAIPLEDFKKESSQIEYKDRFANLKAHYAVCMAGDPVKTKVRLSVIPSRIVHSIAQAQDHYNEVILLGEEGTMLKEQDLLWDDSRSPKQLKLKAEHTGDFEVVGYKDGVGKFTGNLGSLEIASSDRQVQANMSGFSFKVRAEIYANLINKPVEYAMVEDNISVTKTAMPGDSDINIGSIIECMYNGKIKSRDSTIWSVFLPRYKKTRDDKTVANSFAELK